MHNIVNYSSSMAQHVETEMVHMGQLSITYANSHFYHTSIVLILSYLLPVQSNSSPPESHRIYLLESPTSTHSSDFHSADGSWNMRICPIWTEVLVFFIGSVG